MNDGKRAVLTRRLMLSPIGEDDVDELWDLHQDPQVASWTGPWTRQSTAAWARDMAARWERDGVGKWMARSRNDDTLVGRGGLSRIDLHAEGVLEVGWAIRDGLTGHGFASEIGSAALAWAALHLPEMPVVAFTEVHNRASRAVMQRIGLHDAGLIHLPGLIEGREGMQADALFALFRNDRRSDD